MKKILALLLSIAMLLIPMTAFAVTIEEDRAYIYDKITIKGEFTEVVKPAEDAEEDDAEEDDKKEKIVKVAADKIATLVVLGEGRDKDDITGYNLEKDDKLILWADQCMVNAKGEFTFVIDTFEMPEAKADYNFYIAAPGVKETFEGKFTYGRDEMEAALVAQLNGNITQSGMDKFIREDAEKRITRVANEIAKDDSSFEADVVAEYIGLDDKKEDVADAMLDERTFSDLKDFVKKLRKLVDNPPKSSNKNDGGSSSSSSGGGGSFSGAASGELVAPQGPVNPFLDISNTYWGRDAIVSLYNKGIVKGQGNGYFRPDNTITRAEFVQMVVVAFDFIMQGRTAEFTDVADTDWFANSVKIAFGNGVVKGTSDTTFSPSKNITRQDMMTILYNAAKSKGINLTSGNASFTDAGSISGYAQEAVAAMVGSNVVSGYTDGSVKPLNNASRAEAAAMLSRLLEVR